MSNIPVLTFLTVANHTDNRPWAFLSTSVSSFENTLKYLMKQIYLPKDKFAAEKTLELLDQMLRIVPLYVLECDMSEKAVKVTFEMLTGLCYETCRLSKENEEDSYAN